MNSNKDALTDFAQLGKMNEKILKMLARGQKPDKDMKSEVEHTAPPAQSTVIGDEAESKATEIPPLTV